MIVHTEQIRTEVENLFLSEMVQDDRKYLIIGEGDDSIVDDMTADAEECGSLFECGDDEQQYDDIEEDAFYGKYGI